MLLLLAILVVSNSNPNVQPLNVAKQFFLKQNVDTLLMKHLHENMDKKFYSF